MRRKKLLVSVITSALAISSKPVLAVSINPANQIWQCNSIGGSWVCHSASNGSPDLYNPHLTSSQHKQALANALGWVPDDSRSGNCSSCNGHYYEQALPESKQPQQSLNAGPIQVRYDTGNADFASNTISVGGHVQITQPGRTVYANSATVKLDPLTRQATYIEANGDVRVHQPGALLLASNETANLSTHQAEVDNVYYLLKVDPQPGNDRLKDANFTGYAHGKASRMEQTKQNLYSLHHATYTTCPPTSNTWNLSANTIDLDTDSGRGYAYNTLLWVQGVPAFYFPFFSFPLTKDRQSGFLYPTAGWQQGTGAWFSTPYYFNLAPNYDWTFTPSEYVKRGIMLNNLVRYMDQFTSAQLQYNYMPHDMEDNRNHTSISFTSSTQIGPDWQFTTNYSYVSDLDYQLNFNNSAIDANTYQFPQQAQLNFTGQNWNFTGLVQNYQVLGNSILLPNVPYNRLPEFDLGAQYPSFFGPLSFGFHSQVVNFQKNALVGVPDAVEGQRANVSPSISIPLTSSYGFFIPTITESATQYSLTNTTINGFPDNSISRSIPTFDIDTGLYFTRDFQWHGQAYTQTLEPRLFYLYVPYQNQNNIPVFDTGIQDFSYNSLFLTNRFTGLDRIGDANQLSAALSTTINNAVGNKVLTAAMGEIFYFENRQVSICQNQPGQAPCIATEQPGYKQPRSDIAGLFNYYFNNHWSFNSSATYNTFDNQADSQSYQMQYAQDSQHLVNFGYQDNRYEYSLLTNQQLLAGNAPPTLSQLTASFIWQLAPQWSFVGLANYSLNQSLMVNVFGGLQYSSCCWAIQLLEERYLTSNDPNNPNNFNGPASTATVIQFELKGLGGSSSNMDTILAQIPGYNTQQTGF